MKRSTIVLALLLILWVPSRGEGARLPPPDPDRGTIGLSFFAAGSFGSKLTAVRVFFVRLEDEVDLRQAGTVVSSNHYRKKQVYLLNCEPGRYVVVAAELKPSQSDPRRTIFLDSSGILQTETLVEPGKVTFLGEILVDLVTSIEQADPVQANFMRLIRPEEARRGFAARFLTGSLLHLGPLLDVDRTPATKRSFFSRAREKVFKKHPAWKALVPSQPASSGAE